jgi:STE24 endopeptidase
MTAAHITFIFVFALILSSGIRFWLNLRQTAHVQQHRSDVPTAFAGSIELSAHQRAADYTIAKAKLGRIDLAVGIVWILLLTLAGGLDLFHRLVSEYIDTQSLWHGIALFGIVSVLGFVWELPLSLYQTFVLEARFGFNRMTPATFVSDTLKQAAMAVAIGIPLLWLVLWLMRSMGANWWIWTWAVWLGFNLAMMIIYPLFIAPLFNKFEPLRDESLAAQISALLERCGFRAKGLFVMDGSRRSAHGNAYFTGFGAGKRIVFFDTLLNSLTPDEVEAVLAHELGHFKHHHLWKRVVVMALVSFGLLGALGWLSGQSAFYEGLGVHAQSEALALMLFSLVLPVLLFPLTPVMSFWSRKHEFEADSYAVTHADAHQLVNALVKLYRDNASTLTPDPVHSLFYDSHPPAAIRIGRLRKA